MVEDHPPFIWESFINEKRGAVEQIMVFIQQVAFDEALYPFLTPDESSDVGIIDTDLRLGEQSLFDSKFEEFTIDLEQ